MSKGLTACTCDATSTRKCVATSGGFTVSVTLPVIEELLVSVAVTVWLPVLANGSMVGPTGI